MVEQTNELAALAMRTVACQRCAPYGNKGILYLNEKCDCPEVEQGARHVCVHYQDCDCLSPPNHGKILDPQLANLREVLMVKHTDCPTIEDECGPFAWNAGEVSYYDGPNCHGTGYVRRTWDGPDWWLRHLLFWAATMDGLHPIFREDGTNASAIVTALKVKA